MNIMPSGEYLLLDKSDNELEQARTICKNVDVDPVNDSRCICWGENGNHSIAQLTTVVNTLKAAPQTADGILSAFASLGAKISNGEL